MEVGGEIIEVIPKYQGFTFIKNGTEIMPSSENYWDILPHLKGIMIPNPRLLVIKDRYMTDHLVFDGYSARIEVARRYEKFVGKCYDEKKAFNL